MIKNISAFLIGFVIAFFLVVQFSPVVAQEKVEKQIPLTLSLKVSSKVASTTLETTDSIKEVENDRRNADIVRKLTDIDNTLQRIEHLLRKQ